MSARAKQQQATESDESDAPEGAQLTTEEEKVALRRQKNREAARRVRERRINAIASLTAQVEQLSAEKAELLAKLRAVGSPATSASSPGASDRLRELRDSGVQTEPQQQAQQEAAQQEHGSQPTMEGLWQQLQTMQAALFAHHHQQQQQQQQEAAAAAASSTQPAADVQQMQALLQMQLSMLQLANARGVAMSADPAGLQAAMQQQQAAWAYSQGMDASHLQAQALLRHYQQQQQQQQHHHQEEQQQQRASAAEQPAAHAQQPREHDQLEGSAAAAAYYQEARAGLQPQDRGQPSPGTQQRQQQQQRGLRGQQQRGGAAGACSSAAAAAAAPACDLPGDVLRFKPIPETGLLEDESVMMSTDLGFNTGEMAISTSELNAMLLPSEEILRHVPLPEEAAASRSTAWL